jgi:predicted ATPase
MRIAISGTACQGKTTLLKDFLDQWPAYTTSKKTYRDVIKDSNLDHSSKTNKKTQWDILNFMIEELQKTRSGDKIIFDRCPLDNLVYSIWSQEKNNSDIDEKFIKKCIPLVRESLRYLDIIFFTPTTKVATVELEEDDLRDTDSEFIEEVDHVFKAVHRDHKTNPKSSFFISDDKPAMIEVFGKRRERIEIIKLYLDGAGDIYEPGNILDEDLLQEMESLSGVWDGADPTEHSFIQKAMEKQIAEDKKRRQCE